MTDPTDLEEVIKRLRREVKLGEQDNDRLARSVLELQRGTVRCSRFRRAALAPRVSTPASTPTLHPPPSTSRACLAFAGAGATGAALAELGGGGALGHNTPPHQR